jgi:glutathione S-transferase
MALTLYYHPFSSYSWKVLIPLYEAGTPFNGRSLADDDAIAEWKALWPIERFPVLVDDVRKKVLPESSIIIEFLDSHYPGAAPMLPHDEDARLDVRFLDRVFDNYVHNPMQVIVFDRMREEGRKDPLGVERAHAMLDRAYGWLDERVKDRTFACGEAFTLADCAAAPALFYADWVHPIGETQPNLAAYRARLLARPSVKRVVDDARPSRKLFPGGAPDRD